MRVRQLQGGGPLRRARLAGAECPRASLLRGEPLLPGRRDTGVGQDVPGGDGFGGERPAAPCSVSCTSVRSQSFDAAEAWAARDAAEMALIHATANSAAVEGQLDALLSTLSFTELVRTSDALNASRLSSVSASLSSRTGAGGDDVSSSAMAKELAELRSGVALATFVAGQAQKVHDDRTRLASAAASRARVLGPRRPERTVDAGVALPGA